MGGNSRQRRRERRAVEPKPSKDATPTNIVQNPARSLPERRLAQLREASKIGAVYLFDWIVLAIIVGAALAFGSVAMTDYKYTLAELLFVLGIGLFVAKAILDHRNHLLRRLIAVFFVVAGGISLILLVFWVEWDRRHDSRLLTESPDIRLNVEDVTLVRSADFPSSDSVIIFYLTARNVGQMASVVEGYSLGVEVPNRRAVSAEIVPVPETVIFQSPDGERTQFNKSDAIYNKTLKPISRGAIEKGIMAFVVRGVSEPEMVNAICTLSWRDVLGKPGSIKAPLVKPPQGWRPPFVPGLEGEHLLPGSPTATPK